MSDKFQQIIIQALNDEVRALRYLLSEFERTGVFNGKEAAKEQLVSMQKCINGDKAKAFDALVHQVAFKGAHDDTTD